MPFDLSFPTTDRLYKKLQLEPGEALYILGANGTGKSSLLQKFNYQNNQENKSSRWISAHRQTWLYNDAPDMSQRNKRQAEEDIQHEERNPTARYRDNYAGQRTSIALQNLITTKRDIDRAVAKEVKLGNSKKAKKLSDERPSPIDAINDLFPRSNLPIHLRIVDDERLMVRKGKDGAEYGVSEMSDGERNALLITADVLTAPPDTLFLIDEPERHLHRSIAAPLLAHLFEHRQDCGFVISTHDLDLPMGTPEAHVLLLRECSFEWNKSRRWVADELKSKAAIDEGLKRDVLGARRKILFVEGKNNSLDKPLYERLFPSVSVIPKSGCVEVERAVTGLRSGEERHWLKVYGIVDGDGEDDDKIVEDRKQQDIYTLPYYSVEAIYFHPDMIKKIAEMKATELGREANELCEEAIAAGIAAVAENKDHLIRNKAKRIANRKLMDQLPSDDILLTDSGKEIKTPDGPGILQNVKGELDRAVSRNNWEEILKMCPFHESRAKEKIATVFGYKNAAFYEKAVIEVLRQDKEAAKFALGLFGDLADLLSGPETATR